MILKEDYIFSYNMFLAEQELQNSILEKSSILLTENFSQEDLDIVCEGVHDTVTNYLNKITQNIQQAWQKFTTTVGTQKHKDYLTKIAPKIKASNPNFTINNYPNYDINTLTNYKVQRYNRQTMGNDLKLQKVYMQKYYSSLYSERNNMNVMMQRNVVKGYINIKCNRAQLIKSYNFCSTGFYEARKSIENDINIINESVNNIIQSLQMVKSTQESTEAIYESIILEVINQQQSVNKATKMSFSDSDGSNVKPGQKGTQNQNSFINQISNYMKISTLVISAKMKVLTQMYKTNLNIVKHYADITQFGEPTGNKQVNKVQTK